MSRRIEQPRQIYTQARITLRPHISLTLIGASLLQSDLDVLPALPQVAQLGDLAQNKDAEQQAGDLDHGEGDRHAADRAEGAIEAGDKEVDARALQKINEKNRPIRWWAKMSVN